MDGVMRIDPSFINLIKDGVLDKSISEISIEEIYMLDNDVKNAILDRLKVIDGMELPR